jgi:L-seryl-tRNA(Ser) seleniumtransferase
MPRLSPYERLGVPEVINAVGHATRLGGSRPAPEVVAAMEAASQPFIEIDDLQAAASRIIAACTGAEAGIATCGASAALALAAAACLAGNDPDRMDRLPEISDCPRFEIIHPRPGPYDYDHSVRVSGARLIMIDYTAPEAPAMIRKAIGPRTAALAFVWREGAPGVALPALVELAHWHDLPVIVDAAIALPPAENLRTPIAQGADLVAYSGGKHLGGPQASGFLCGRTDLIRSAWAQMVDMDVRPGTWSLQSWVEAGWIARPPRHGIGRAMKVGKEAVIGLLTALEHYAIRDHDAERAAWLQRTTAMGAGLAGLEGIRVQTLLGGPENRRYPKVMIESGASPGGMSVGRLIQELRRLPRKVLLSVDEQSPDRAYLYPACLSDHEAALVVSAIRAIVTEHSQNPGQHP